MLFFAACIESISWMLTEKSPKSENEGNVN